VAKLAERFVPVRLQAMNGQNINLFQFDYDLTWMAFFMDSQDRIYARYGGREDAGPDTLLTKNSLVYTMTQVLELHRAGRVQARHEPSGLPVRTPEDNPAMSAQMKGRRERCIHCHDVKAAEFRTEQQRGKFSKDLIFTYPPPSSLGLTLSPDRQDTIVAVQPGSLASKANLRAGDTLLELDGYRILTAADLARVLHLMPRESAVPLLIRRGGTAQPQLLTLTGDWKRTADPSWRSSTHWAGPNGGFWGVTLYDDEKTRLGIPTKALGVRINFFFKNQPAPLEAGLKVNDILVEFDGMRDNLTLRQIHAHLQMNRAYGDKVPLVILRDGKELKLTLKLPEKPNWQE
jgi:C-terminal processing protease CtpA/Prc